MTKVLQKLKTGNWVESQKKASLLFFIVLVLFDFLFELY